MECKIYTIYIKDVAAELRRRAALRRRQRNIWLAVAGGLAAAAVGLLAYALSQPPVVAAEAVPAPTPSVAVIALTEPVPLPEAEHIPATASPTEPCFVPADVPLDADLQADINGLCEEYGVPFELVMAVAQQETRFQNVLGDDGRSFGYMQIQARWHQERMNRLGVADLSDPISNFAVGIDYLATLLEEYQDTHRALMAYNMGPSGAAKLWGQGIYSSAYSREVMKTMSDYERR